MPWMIGIDTGGTFTDVIAIEVQTGQISTAKVPSTPADPSQAVLDGVNAILSREDSASPETIDFFAHGTTVATNAVIERKGKSTGLLITKGMNAVYPGRMSRQPPPTEMLNPNFSKPAPLIAAGATREIHERMSFDGEVLEELEEDSVIAAITDLVEVNGIESLAVCLIFAFMNPAHERRVKEIVRARFPDIRISLSSDLIPIIREYRRLSTTVLDAFVGPTLEKYLRKVGGGLRDLGIETRQVFIMQSNGGLMSIDVASRNPVQTLLSGPAAGVISSCHIAALTKFKNVVTFDVGGTSTDIATIIDGEATETVNGAVAGFDTAITMNEISTIGAGGGTIARVGVDGRLKVGPDSAGASPGPVCYGLGGEEPTVTDAAIYLSYLSESSFLGGKFKVDRALAENAIAEKIAAPLGLSTTAAANGIIRVVTSTMESELRLRLMARGHDPRTFALIAFGGAGPLYAAFIARNLGIKHVIVPPYPGLGSAMGLLLTDIKHNYVQSRLRPLDDFDPAEVTEMFNQLVREASAESETEDVDPAALELNFYLDLRYVGQGYELSVRCDGPGVTRDLLQNARKDFDDLHEKTFGHSAPEKPVEVVNVRVTSLAVLPKLKLPEIAEAANPDPADACTGHRDVNFDQSKAFVKTPVYARTSLRLGHEVSGPAIVEQFDTTTVVLPGQVAKPDRTGNLIIEAGGAE